MTSIVAAWTALAEKLGTAGMEIFRTAEAAITSKGFSDEKVLALTLLARSVSNLKGVLVLLRARRIVEARTITRCSLENLYWTVAITERGENFVRQMLHDEMSRRKARGQFIFQSELELDTAIEGRLREWLKDANKRFAAPSLSIRKMLHRCEPTSLRHTRSILSFHRTRLTPQWTP